MDLDQTFSRVAFYQVLLGILTFCYAEANPGMLLVSGSLVVLSRYISEGPWGRPMPRWAVNMMAVTAFGWMAMRIALANQNIIVTMGHFTMWLQVLVMFARKSNRDYGHILMLSLLQMIGASVLSVSIVYGLLLGVYCVLAMLTLLIFQLKGSSDRVFEANRAAAADRRRVTRPAPVVGRGYRWQFRLTATVIALGCALVAASVFVLMPRTQEGTLLGGGNARIGPREVGFNPQVRLDGPPITQGSREPVMNLRVTMFGEPLTSRSWLMRGAALDMYDPESRVWKRSQEVADTDQRVRVGALGLTLAQLDPMSTVYRARVTLRQIGHRNLFTIYPVTSFSSDSIQSVVFSRQDTQLSAGGTVMGAVIYDMTWPAIRVRDIDERYIEPDPQSQDSGFGRISTDPPARAFNPASYARGWPIQRERFAEYARGVIGEAGLSRDPFVDYDPNDNRIAQVLAEHLRDEFQYQLGGPSYPQGSEPIVEFLFGHKTGHCELFASALAALTRSLGMQARVITGYRAGEYNQIGGYYVVRQSDAHAWTEINLGPGQGWHSYDATPAAEIDRQDRRDRSWTTVLREAYEHIEFGWIRSIVAYDVGTRDALLTRIADRFKALTTGPDSLLGQFVTFFRMLPDAWRLDRANTLKVLGSGALALLISTILLRRIALRRRNITRLKLASVSGERRVELAQQLSFFIDMGEMLDRHGYPRAPSENPRDYAIRLSQEQPDRMEPVLPLTDLFYRVRFGGRPLDATQRKRVRVYLRQLERALTYRG